MLSKEEFVKIINQLQEVSDLQDTLNDEIRKCKLLNVDFVDGHGFVIANEDIVVSLLEKIMNDDCDDISYFIYELNYGRDYKPGMITENDIDIDFSTAEKLYDYLVQDKKDNNDDYKCEGQMDFSDYPEILP